MLSNSMPSQPIAAARSARVPRKARSDARRMSPQASPGQVLLQASSRQMPPPLASSG
jgi:hypothetical protein